MSKPPLFLPETPLPYSCQTLGEAEIQAVVQVLQSAAITQGPAIQAFEEAVAAWCQVPYAVAFSSGTAALHAACHAAGLSPGDEAVTTPLSFVATSNAVLYLQARPVFADINPDTWNLDPEQAAAKITPQTRALIPVHFAGQPVDLEAFYALADRHNLVVIEDACHALGAWHHGQPIGQCRDMAVFSFHPVKSITTGEGGMVVTPHRHYYEKLLKFRSHGLTRDADDFEVFTDPAPWHYEMQELGYNYRITDMQAAMGQVQMSRLDGFVQARSRLAQRYIQAFDGQLPLRMQQALPDTRSAHHLFCVWLYPDASPLSRRKLFEALVERRIRPQVHYIPIHLQPYYQKHLGTRRGDFPHAERYYEQCLSLPLYPALTDEAQDYVIHCMQTLLNP